jgi:protein-tyrosine-phosphatase/ectoine hydroxylase-related dioxygenase (phytanoyl-CoA dioxygenase family)
VGPAAGGAWHNDFVPPRPEGGLRAVQLFVILTDLPARGGGTLVLTGSHHLIGRYLADSGAAPHPRQLRHVLGAHPWLRDLWQPSRCASAEQRIHRFMTDGTRIGGVDLRVVELTGRAGDAYVMHCDTFHAAAPNCRHEPRLMATNIVLSTQRLTARDLHQADLMYSRAMEEFAPPTFLSLAGHPVRWRLLGELARSDRQVHELTSLVGHPQNLVSYHLGRLRRANLVTARRSSADGRDTYYRLDLALCGQLMAAAGGALHPALLMTPPESPVPQRRRSRVRVLFLCTGNSSRSQMAEAILRQVAGNAVQVHSAGSRPKPVHPHAVAVMAEHGIDLTAARAKHLDEFRGRRFDHVITLCDRVREVCPEFPGDPQPVHWSIPDPAQAPEGYPAFQRTATEIAERIRFLLHRVFTVIKEES